MAKLDFATWAEKRTHYGPERRYDGGLGHFCYSRELFSGAWLLLGDDMVEMFGATVPVVGERASGNLFCETVGDETDDHGGSESASTWSSTSVASPRTFPLAMRQ